MMEMTRKHLLSLAILTAFSPVLVTQAHAQLHLEIEKHLKKRLKLQSYLLAMTVASILL